jgi:hypothetical protein
MVLLYKRHGSAMACSSFVSSRKVFSVKIELMASKPSQEWHWKFVAEVTVCKLVWMLLRWIDEPLAAGYITLPGALCNGAYRRFPGCCARPLEALLPVPTISQPQAELHRSWYDT